MLDKYSHFLSHCFRDVPTSLLVGLAVVFCVGTVLFLALMGGKKGAKWSAGMLLVEFFFLLVFLAVLVRKMHRMFNFTPFWSYQAISQGGNDALLTQNIMNLCAFIPIGLLLGCAFGRMKWWKPLLIGLGFSLFIETLQFVLKRGFTEFDDVFHNVLGCMIGYGVFMGIAALIKRFKG